MCGIFGIAVKEDSGFSAADIEQSLKVLITLSELRGKDSSGLSVASQASIKTFRRAVQPSKMIEDPEFYRFVRSCISEGASEKIKAFAAIGHCRLVTDGSQAVYENNQPVRAGKIIGVHNGIVVNAWKLKRAEEKENELLSYESVDSASDTKVLFEIIGEKFDESGSIVTALREAYGTIEGSASVAFFCENLNAVCLATNTGSLYYASGCNKPFFCFASEKHILEEFLKKARISAKDRDCQTKQLKANSIALVDLMEIMPQVFMMARTDKNTGGDTSRNAGSCFEIIEKRHSPDSLRRCTRCILPETYPFIHFDDKGVCNYCHNYHKQVNLGRQELEKILDKYRSKDGSQDCLVGLSGGRDSSYGLHSLVRDYGMHPLVYTYDWGLTTDQSRRNQALLCGKLGLEHIIRAADIQQKRSDIRENIYAWLKHPHLGMVPLFFQGDKPFIYYGGKLLKEAGLKLAVFCSGNQLEQMEFKLGFCGVDQPLKSNPRMYSYKLMTKVRIALFYSYQYLINPAYINKSLFDSFFGFYSSFIFRDNALFLYHYIPWNEKVIEETLEKEYGWKKDQRYGDFQWRMGDGQTAFSNYIYYTIAGFSEFDAFRSNQIRAGLITRQEAQKLAAADNKPRIETLKYFSQIVGFNLEEVLAKINEIPKLYY